MIKLFKPLLFLCFIFLISCSQRQHQIQFYTWKSSPNLGQNEKEVFQNTRAHKLYLRLFDIDKKEGETQPAGILKSFFPELLKADYIPVVFITNRVFYGLDTSENKKLSQNIYNLIQKITAQYNIDFNEIQIDCDWTKSTKDAYFSFLKNLKKQTKKEITCTLRLHQVKYKGKTGVPPVDKVYLMCYATSSPIKTKEGNSILDINLLKNYLQNINDYPLRFDVALPLYSWAIVTNHIGRKKIINGISKSDLKEEDFTFISKNNYTVKRNLFLSGIYLNKGFRLKIEGVSPELLRTCKDYLNKKIVQSYDIVYFHLDHKFTDRFTIKDLL